MFLIPFVSRIFLSWIIEVWQASVLLMYLLRHIHFCELFDSSTTVSATVQYFPLTNCGPSLSPSFWEPSQHLACLPPWTLHGLLKLLTWDNAITTMNSHSSSVLKMPAHIYSPGSSQCILPSLSLDYIPFPF